MTDTGPPPVEGTAPTASPDPLRVRRTRTSTAYVGTVGGLVVLVGVIIFIVQNLHEDTIHFLGAHFRLPEGILILASAVAGGVIVLLVSLARVAQLRMMARRHRAAHQES